MKPAVSNSSRLSLGKHTLLDTPQVRKGLTTVVSSCISHTTDVFSPSRPHFRRATSSISFRLPFCTSVQIRAATCPILSLVTECCTAL